MALFLSSEVFVSIFVYADESGVFDHVHENHFVFGGVIFLDKAYRDSQQRMYQKAERDLGPNAGTTPDGELKATTLSRAHKGKLFRSLNKTIKFAVVVDLKRINANIFEDKKTKQRYLDYAFKRGLKNVLVKLMNEGLIPADYSESIIVRMDEHTTATDGRYELRESLEQEFKIGTFNGNWNTFHPPILPNIAGVELELRDSKQDPLIRAADIVANRVYFLEREQKFREAKQKVTILKLP